MLAIFLISKKKIKIYKTVVLLVVPTGAKLGFSL
jgi:hypothetical protein